MKNNVCFVSISYLKISCQHLAVDFLLNMSMCFPSTIIPENYYYTQETGNRKHLLGNVIRIRERSWTL